MKKEALKSAKVRIQEIIKILSNEYPDVKIQLDFRTPFDLLIATILSAQCTDARVNLVTKELFAKYSTPLDYIAVPQEQIEKEIFSTGFYRAKAKNIQAACQIIIERFNGELPQTMDELLSLPGVGRKTANVVLGHCFDTPGIVVDTHVIRLSNRMGFVATTDAVEIEYALMKIIDKKVWVTFTHYFINHGRNTCKGRKPNCSACVVNELCPKIL